MDKFFDVSGNFRKKEKSTSHATQNQHLARIDAFVQGQIQTLRIPYVCVLYFI